MSHFLQLTEQFTERLQNVSPAVVAAYLFGSAARQEETPLSDVDIAVYLDEPVRERRVAAYSALHRELEQALGKSSLDLVLLNDAAPVLAGRIVAGHLLYSADDSRRVSIETEILSRQQDHLPIMKQYDRQLHARIRAGFFGKRSPLMIDRQSVNDRLAHIQTTLQQLYQRRELSRETLKNDVDKRGATLYELQTCIEAMSDIANHIIAATGLPKPRDRGEAFTILAQADILPVPLARDLTEAVGMRNIIVHGYLGLTLDVVYQALQDDLPKIESFAGHIIAHMDEIADDG